MGQAGFVQQFGSRVAAKAGSVGGTSRCLARSAATALLAITLVAGCSRGSGRRSAPRYRLGERGQRRGREPDDDAERDLLCQLGDLLGGGYRYRCPYLRQASCNHRTARAEGGYLTAPWAPIKPSALLDCLGKSGDRKWAGIFGSPQQP